MSPSFSFSSRRVLQWRKWKWCKKWTERKNSEKIKLWFPLLAVTKHDNHLSRNSNHHKHKTHQNIVLASFDSFFLHHPFVSIHDAPRHRGPMQRDDHGSKSVKAKDIIMVCVTRERLNAELFTFIKFMKRISVLNKTKEYIRNCVLSTPLFFSLFRRTSYFFFLCTTGGFVLEFSVVFFFSFFKIYSHKNMYICLKFIAIILSIAYFFSGCFCYCCCIWNKVRNKYELCVWWVCCDWMKA